MCSLYSRNLIRIFILFSVACTLFPPNCGGLPLKLRSRGELDGRKSLLFERVLRSMRSISHPSYRHKLLQLQRNKWTTNSYERNRDLVDYQAIPSSVTTYPVAGKLIKFYPVEPLGSVVTHPVKNGWIPSANESDEGKVTYTPYIGMRAFTSILTFFNHLTENFKIVHQPLR